MQMSKQWVTFHVKNQNEADAQITHTSNSTQHGGRKLNALQFLLAVVLFDSVLHHNKPQKQGISSVWVQFKYLELFIFELKYLTTPLQPYKLIFSTHLHDNK